MEQPSKPRLWPLLLLLAYAVLVHSADTLASIGVRLPFDWRIFRWAIAAGGPIPLQSGHGVRLLSVPGFDAFKFLAWFIIPLLFSLRSLDSGYFGFGRWCRADYAIVAALALVGVVAVLSILIVPGLRSYYPSLRGMETADKWRYVAHMTAYTLSWLVGWEFLHRYALLTRLQARWPKYGWLLIPVIEGLYHLVKHPLEAAAMVVYGFGLTYWARHRRNTLAPALTHLVIEMELLVFMVLV